MSKPMIMVGVGEDPAHLVVNEKAKAIAEEWAASESTWNSASSPLSQPVVVLKDDSGKHQIYPINSDTVDPSAKDLFQLHEIKGKKYVGAMQAGAVVAPLSLVAFECSMNPEAKQISFSPTATAILDRASIRLGLTAHRPAGRSTPSAQQVYGKT
ncbi:MAG: hypothetical protein HGA90_02065 [Alphaproteobacteria bacterium]|nr:hypothetical protein [Alphaproteobacteria bacterium]